MMHTVDSLLLNLLLQLTTILKHRLKQPVNDQLYAIFAPHARTHTQSNLHNELQGCWGQRRYILGRRHSGRSPLCCYSLPEVSTDGEKAVHTHLHLQLETDT